MKRVNKSTEVGLDTIEINITGIKTAIEETELKHTRTGEKIGTIKKRNGRDIQSDCLLKQNTEHGFKSEAENKALTAKTGLLGIKKDQ